MQIITWRIRAGLCAQKKFFCTFTPETITTQTMFLGHFGLGLGIKKAAPRVSLGTIFIAVQFADLLWPTLLLLGVEHAAIKPLPSPQPLDFTDYPYSHSLAMLSLWGLLFGLVHWLFKKDIKAAVILFFCVISHWLLDLPVHLQDLPLYPGSPKYGFSLWNYKMATLCTELAIYIAGTVLYLNATRARNTLGNILIWVLIIFLLLVHVSNFFGPAPKDIMAVAWMAQAQWIIILLAYWADSKREARI